MAKGTEYPGFETLGADIKEARKALGLSRRALAEQVSIDPRYLANIENSGDLPSVPVLYELARICKLPIERYFHPEAEPEGSEQHTWGGAWFMVTFYYQKGNSILGYRPLIIYQ